MKSDPLDLSVIFEVSDGAGVLRTVADLPALYLGNPKAYPDLLVLTAGPAPPARVAAPADWHIKIP